MSLGRTAELNRAAALVAVFGVVAGGAGCTKVTVGRNGDPRLVQDASDATQDPAPGSPEANGSCFSAAQELSPAVSEICNGTPADMRQPFARALKLLCDEKTLARLAEPRCAWDGTPASQTRHFRVLERTGPTDAAPAFDFLAAYSVGLATSVEDYLDLFYETYIDPSFPQRYLMVKNSRISDGVADRAAGTIDYKIELATSSAAVSYRGHVVVKQLGSGVTAIYDRATSDKVLVKESNVLSLLFPRPEADGGGSVLVLIDDKQVDDGGNHRIALSTATSLDKERMVTSYENAKRKAGR